MKKNQLQSLITIVVSVLTLSLLTIGTANAQFTIGIKAGVNATSYKQITDKSFGLEAGIFMRLGSSFFFEPEVLYTFKSSSVKDAIAEITDNIKLKQHFVSVPALLGYHFINKDNFKFRIMLGPRFDFKISDNLKDFQWNSNTVQWGGQVGVGMDIWRFAIDFHYCISADKFKKKDPATSTTTTETDTQRMNMFILSLGFKFIK